MPLISVVIPVYNSEKTIERCVNSIVSKKAEFEIICIDDGSKDNSLSILNELKEKNERLRVVHQDNAGAGVARNTGLTLVKGDFVMFCDSDDTYLLETIDYIVEDIIKYSPDYIVFQRKAVLTDGSIHYWGEGSDFTLLNCAWDEYLNNYMIQRGHGMGVVTKVYKKSIIEANNIRFGSFLFGEDLWFNLNYIMNCNSFIEDYRATYQQYQSAGSICMRAYDNYYKLNMECINYFEKNYQEKSLFISSFIYRLKYNILKRSINRIMQGIDALTFYEKYKKSQNLFTNSEVRYFLKMFLGSENLPISEKINIKLIISGSVILYICKNYFYPRIRKNAFNNTLAIFIKKVLHKLW